MVLEEVLELLAMAQGREARQELELLPVPPLFLVSKDKM
jgi:hypothetical protein